MKIHYHLPGLFEFYDLYAILLPLFRNHREYFYDWCDIGSIYGAPSDCIWAGGRIETSSTKSEDVISLLSKYEISARLTLSNLCLTEANLSDKYCNNLISIFDVDNNVHNGIIVASDVLLDYLSSNTKYLYFVSSTTKVITDFSQLKNELNKSLFKYVVPDFRFNKRFNKLMELSDIQKNKVEFLCNECCPMECIDRKECYENLSMRILGTEIPEHKCSSQYSYRGYCFSEAMSNPMFIGIDDIKNKYYPLGFTNFKIEGRGLGSALVFEMILYYMVKSEYQLLVREAVYLDSMLDLF